MFHLGKVTIMAIKLIATDEAISKEIKLIKVAGKKLQERIHQVAVSIMARWAETGDRRPMLVNINALVEAMPEMGRGNALRAWVQLHFQLGFEGKQLVWPEGVSFTPNAEQIKAAADEPFWALQPEPEYKPVDFNALLKKLIKSAEKDLEKTGAESSVDPTVLAKLKDLVQG